LYSNFKSLNIEFLLIIDFTKTNPLLISIKNLPFDTIYCIYGDILLDLPLLLKDVNGEDGKKL
jgi:hypothetical protein